MHSMVVVPVVWFFSSDIFVSNVKLFSFWISAESDDLPQAQRQSFDAIEHNLFDLIRWKIWQIINMEAMDMRGMVVAVLTMVLISYIRCEISCLEFVKPLQKQSKHSESLRHCWHLNRMPMIGVALQEMHWTSCRIFCDSLIRCTRASTFE